MAAHKGIPGNRGAFFMIYTYYPLFSNIIGHAILPAIAMTLWHSFSNGTLIRTRLLAMNRTGHLKACLDSLAASYDSRYLDTDPLGIVREYDDQPDRETAGLIVSALSYGGAAQIRKSARAALIPCGSSPASFALSLSPADARDIFRGFKHRWTDGNDIAFLFLAAGRMMREYGSIGGLMRSLDDSSTPTIETVMIRFAAWMASARRLFYGNEIVSPKSASLIPSPAQKSTCKRLAMYFRWMVRGPDGIDFGIWGDLSPARLIIPVDRHIARMALLLGLARRKTVDWVMARDITQSLRGLDPGDPLRYDFALVRPGITRECTGSSKGNCASCALAAVCGEAE